MFSDGELERYARHIVLREVGAAGQQRLRTASVTIIGAGGIGAPVALYLVAAGIGTLTIIDDDRVDSSNLARQVLFDEEDIGREKVDAAVERLHRVNGFVELRSVPARIDRDNATSLLDGASIVVDGSDNFATRLAVADCAYKLRTPLISAAIGQFHGQVGTWRGWEDDQPCYRCYVGDAFDADDCDSCAADGVIGAITGMVGSFAALEAIRAIVNFGDAAAGRLHLIDGLAPSMRTVTIPKDPACATCGGINGL